MAGHLDGQLSVATVEPCSASFHSSFHSDSAIEVHNLPHLGPAPDQDPTKTVAEHEVDVTDSVSSDDRRTLRKIADKIPYSAFLVALVELCERFAFYGLSGPFQNYMERPYGSPAGPGAIGLGQSGATRLNNLFQCWCYVTPIFGAVIADQYFGKFNTILYFALIYILGLLVLVATSLPAAIQEEASLGGLIAAMIIIGLGSGGIKANVSPLIAEQYSNLKPRIRVLGSGERVIVDPAVTIQRIYMIFYWCINLGSLSGIATTHLELHVDFWAAYILPLGMFIVGFLTIVLAKKHYVQRPPQGSIIPRASRAIWIGLTNGFNMDAAISVYNDHFIHELKRTLVACKIFAFFPIYWLCYGQMITNFISQANQMQLHGIPNDIMQNIDPLTIIVFIPILDRLVYPSLRSLGIPFRPVTRIALGFFCASLAMAYAACVQHLIYVSPPCYKNPSSATQTPAYLLVALSEIFACVTGLEYAYTKAPASMKSFVMSLFLLTNAFGAVLGMAISPLARNPKILWMYTGLAIASATTGLIFWILFRKYNKMEEQMNRLEEQGQKAEAVVNHRRVRSPEIVDGVNVW